MRTLLFLLSCLAAFTTQAQSDVQLALEYFRSGDCQKALIHTERVLKESFSRDMLTKHADCLIKEKQWDRANSFFADRIKSDENYRVYYHFHWGRVLEAQGKGKDSDNKYEAAVQALRQRPDLYAQLIEKFRRVSKPVYAKQVILAARESQRSPHAFSLELAGVYRDLDEPESMVKELLQYGSLIRNPEIVQNMLQDFLRDESDHDILEKVLYENIQKRPNEVFFNQLLIWQQVQRKDFYKAFIQERSLDKRLKNNGMRILDLSKIALQNEDYTNTLRMYDYLLKEYPNTEIYPYAKRMSIYVREEQTKRNYPVDLAEVRKLIGDYEALIKEVEGGLNVLQALRNMALLNAFYLGDRKSAIELLEKAIDLAKNETSFADQCKLDLGDIYILENEPWEASLLYSQVEKSQKDNILGYEAKLRNAKLYYYKGEFELSKGILNVLKKATSREIANDASALSLLIQDNTGLDSTEEAMKAYAAVELLLFQHRYAEAIDTLDVLYERYRDHSLADEILWLQATTYLKLDKNLEAEKCLLEIIEHFHYDILGDNALYELARLYETKLNRTEEAMEQYRQLLEKYPGSIYVADARKRYRLLRGDVIN